MLRDAYRSRIRTFGVLIMVNEPVVPTYIDLFLTRAQHISLFLLFLNHEEDLDIFDGWINFPV
jgi:hypothetical protein